MESYVVIDKDDNVIDIGFGSYVAAFEWADDYAKKNGYAYTSDACTVMTETEYVNYISE